MNIKDGNINLMQERCISLFDYFNSSRHL